MQKAKDQKVKLLFKAKDLISSLLRIPLQLSPADNPQEIFFSTNPRNAGTSTSWVTDAVQSTTQEFAHLFLIINLWGN